MAICDGNYKFIYVDAGKNGRISDGGVFNKCSFAGALRSKAMNLPSTRALPGRATKIPFVFVADDAFAIRPNLLKPFAGRNLSPLQRVFNYRLSRGRRCIENAFGIMSAVFRVMRTPILLGPVKARKITLACCVLHNFLLSRNDRSTVSGNVDRYAEDGTVIEGQWRREFPNDTLYSLEHLRGRYCTDNANFVRDEMAAYFMSAEGEIPWQFKHI